MHWQAEVCHYRALFKYSRDVAAAAMCTLEPCLMPRQVMSQPVWIFQPGGLVLPSRQLNGSNSLRLRAVPACCRTGDSSEAR